MASRSTAKLASPPARKLWIRAGWAVVMSIPVAGTRRLVLDGGHDCDVVRRRRSGVLVGHAVSPGLFR